MWLKNHFGHWKVQSQPFSLLWFLPGPQITQKTKPTFWFSLTNCHRCNSRTWFKQIIPPPILLFHWALFHSATPVALNLYLIAQLKAAHTTQPHSCNSTPSTFCFFTLPSDTSVQRRCRCRRMQNKSESTVQLYKSLQGHWHIFSESYLHLWCRFLASPDAQEVMWVTDWLTNH